MTPFDEELFDWMQTGIERGWIGPPICYTHDGFPVTEEEDTNFALGKHQCIYIFRKYNSTQHKHDVEQYHNASKWGDDNDIF